jgi:hypothetical protein
MPRATPYAIHETDRAVETAIAFLHARRAGEISYGRAGRTGSCVITHPSFKERWLKVKWWAAGEMIRFAWEGEVLSIGLDGVSRPRIFGFFDWEAVGVYYRAIMMSVASGFLSKQRSLEQEVVVEPQWWDELKNAVETVQAKQTDRIYVPPERVARRLKERFGLELGSVPWQTAHGDLHWGNLTAPKFSIVDWETWGQAPFGFDIAQLHLMSLAQPETLAKVHQVFSAVVAKPEYDVALLYLIAEEMRCFDDYGHAPALQPLLHQGAERVLAARRFAAFCRNV